MHILSMLKFDADGVVPAVIQDHDNGEILMVGSMNRVSIAKTIELGKVCFWRRNNTLWIRGEESGHFQIVKSIAVDCYGGSLLFKVEQVVASCHFGYRSCFYREVSLDGRDTRIVGEKIFQPVSE